MNKIVFNTTLAIRTEVLWGVLSFCMLMLLERCLANNRP